MESYSEFLERIGSFEVPELGINVNNFTPSNSVLQKVDENNRFSPFFGDTVVFDLSDDSKKTIKKIVDNLYFKASDCFCEKLIDTTFHMTLHDLSNSPHEEDIYKQMDGNLLRIISAIGHDTIPEQKIRMKSNNIINMVNTSIVLALCPESENEYKKLFAIYDLFDEVYKLPYPFTPHITLAYYNRHGFSYDSGMRLKDAVRALNQHSFSFILDTRKLFYQRFMSMNCYIPISRFL